MTEINVTKFDQRVAQMRIARDTARSMYSRYRRWKQENFVSDDYYVIIEEDDYLFDQVLAWMTKQMPPKDLQLIVADTEHTGWEEGYKIKFYHETESANSFEIGGYTVHAQVTRNKPKAKKNEPRTLRDRIETDLLGIEQGRGTGGGPAGNVDMDQMFNQAGGSHTSFSKNLVFTCSTIEARDAVMDFLSDMVKTMDKREPRFLTFGNVGWRGRSRLTARPIDSVVLADDQRERVVKDFEDFLAQEQRYLELGLPWHRGYLFHGPPGTGKTSLATALAGHFKLDVYFIALSTIESDAKLMEAFSNIDTGRSILVLEDIDIAHAARERDDSGKGITLQGLLNGLDGIATPHGLMTIMTTNDITVLDHALIRPGRVDVTLEIGYLDNDQMDRLCARFLGRKVDVPRITGRITPAEVVGLFKEDSPDVDRQLVDLVIEANINQDVRDGDVHFVLDRVR